MTGHSGAGIWLFASLASLAVHGGGLAAALLLVPGERSSLGPVTEISVRALPAALASAGPAEINRVTDTASAAPLERVSPAEAQRVVQEPAAQRVSPVSPRLIEAVVSDDRTMVQKALPTRLEVAANQASRATPPQASRPAAAAPETIASAGPSAFRPATAAPEDMIAATVSHKATPALHAARPTRTEPVAPARAASFGPTERSAFSPATAAPEDMIAATVSHKATPAFHAARPTRTEPVAPARAASVGPTERSAFSPATVAPEEIVAATASAESTRAIDVSEPIMKTRPAAPGAGMALQPEIDTVAVAPTRPAFAALADEPQPDHLPLSASVAAAIGAELPNASQDDMLRLQSAAAAKPAPVRNVEPEGPRPPRHEVTMLAPANPLTLGRPGEADAYARAVEFLKRYESGGCFVALPSQRPGGLVGLDGFAAESSRLAIFLRDFRRSTGLQAAAASDNVSAAQCRALSFARSLPGYPTFSLYFEMPSRSVASGDVLSGKIRNVAGRSLHLLLVDDEGTVQSVEDFLTANGAEASFSAPMTLTSGPVSTVQLLVALAGEESLQTVSRMNGMRAEVFFGELTEELARRHISADIAIVSFSVHPR